MIVKLILPKDIAQLMTKPRKNEVANEESFGVMARRETILAR